MEAECRVVLLNPNCPTDCGYEINPECVIIKIEGPVEEPESGSVITNTVKARAFINGVTVNYDVMVKVTYDHLEKTGILEVIDK